MTTPELISYVKSQLASGILKENISTALSGQGWTTGDIQEAFNKATPVVTPAVVAPPTIAPSITPTTPTTKPVSVASQTFVPSTNAVVPTVVAKTVGFTMGRLILSLFIVALVTGGAGGGWYLYQKYISEKGDSSSINEQKTSAIKNTGTEIQRPDQVTSVNPASLEWSANINSPFGGYLLLCWDSNQNCSEITENNPYGGLYNGHGAVEYCQALEEGGTGWRLPTRDELVWAQGHTEEIMGKLSSIAKSSGAYGFNSSYWSSTSKDSSYAFEVNFDVEGSSPNAFSKSVPASHTRCVRAQNASVGDTTFTPVNTNSANSASTVTSSTSKSSTTIVTPTTAIDCKVYASVNDIRIIFGLSNKTKITVFEPTGACMIGWEEYLNDPVDNHVYENSRGTIFVTFDSPRMIFSGLCRNKASLGLGEESCVGSQPGATPESSVTFWKSGNSVALTAVGKGNKSGGLLVLANQIAGRIK